MPHALIVEDEPEANKLLAMLVQFRGYQTDSAFNGRDALAKIEQHPPDVVFLDLMLPDVNGYEVCRSVKGRKATALIPVVIVTARVTVENRIQSFTLGADEYVPKPYTPDQIFRALEAAETWRRSLESESDSAHGSFPIGSGDEGETLRQFAKLRSILLARTPLDPDEVARLGRLLTWLATRADEWGLANGFAEVGGFAYQVHPDRVEFALHDQTGWLDADFPPEVCWAAELADARIGRVDSDETQRSIRLVRSVHRS